MTHISYETLLNYLENRLPAEERSMVDEHLTATCPQCDRRMSLVRKVLETVATDHTVAPPSHILQQAINRAKGQMKEASPKFLNRLVASLTFDSHTQLSFAATRGAGRTHQMLFTTEQVDIDLQIKSSRNDHELRGQVLDTQHSGGFLPAFVSLQNNDGQQKATETDSLGQFAFHGVVSGTYDLVFDLEDQEIAVTGLEFRNE
ncbi:MAG: hypothetical protein IPP66_06025 [Anaerolineales bacterium]|nr:hypothetical protein [Anaerolineales bacterium]